jgi:hypothetical protein
MSKVGFGRTMEGVGMTIDGEAVKSHEGMLLSKNGVRRMAIVPAEFALGRVAVSDNRRDVVDHYGDMPSETIPALAA